MRFEKIECVSAFYDDYCGEIFYVFNTIPSVGHGEWAISRGGDVVYDLFRDKILQSGYPPELNVLTSHIPEDMEVEGLEE